LGIVFVLALLRVRALGSKKVYRAARKETVQFVRLVPHRALHLLCAVLAAGVPAFSATPSTGTLSGASSSVNWSGGPFTAVATDTSSCTVLNCDTFFLNINTPPGFFSSFPNDEVQIRITWQGVTNEFDLYLFDPSGNLLASSVQSYETFEEIDAGPLPNGTYKVVIVASQTVNVSYLGTAQIAPDPTVANGKPVTSPER